MRLPIPRWRPAVGLIVVALAAAAPGASGPAYAQQPNASEPRTRTAPPAGLPETRKFLADAAGVSRFEIEAARLALEKSSSEEIRRYAQMMIEGHQRLAADLPGTGRAGPVDVETAPLSAHQARTIAQLRQASGPEFDRLYADSQVLGHRAALELHNDYALDGTDGTVKQAARRAIPQIRHHLAEAQLLQQQIADVPWHLAPADRSPSGQMTPRWLRPGEQRPQPSRPGMPPGQLP